MRKLYRVEIKDGTSICPVCGQINRHRTGKDCGHVSKITAKGVVFYFWGFRPVGFTEGMNAQRRAALAIDRATGTKPGVAK